METLDHSQLGIKLGVMEASVRPAGYKGSEILVGLKAGDLQDKEAFHTFFIYTSFTLDGNFRLLPDVEQTSRSTFGLFH